MIAKSVRVSRCHFILPIWSSHILEQLLKFLRLMADMNRLYLIASDFDLLMLFLQLFASITEGIVQGPRDIIGSPERHVDCAFHVNCQI